MRGVSIIIPCRNGARFLAATLRSALNQTVPADEILVVDDGSSDASAEIARSFGSSVRLLAGPERGAAAARRAGAQKADGSRLMFLDADDLLAPSALGALGDALDEADHPTLAACPWERLEWCEETWRVRAPSAKRPRPGQDALAAWLTGSWSPPAALLWDRAAYELAGGWDPAITVDDDGELVRRALARGVPLRRTPRGLALYRRSSAGDVSLSDQRHSPEGLRSRLRSLTRTREELARAGRLSRYVGPLAEALAELVADAGDDLVAVAARQMARDLGVEKRALERRPRRARAGRAAARLLELGRPPSPPGPHEPLTLPPTAPMPAPDKAPLVSVVIPTYDRGPLLERAVASVLAQTYRTLELLVVDDGSTDDTQARLARIDDPRLRVIRQGNQGVARARNRALREARGAYIAFLDSDDAWLPGKLERQVAALEAAPARVGFCHTALEIRSDTRLLETRPALATGRVFAHLLLWNHVHAPTSSGVIRREVLDMVGGFDVSLPAVEDWEWLQRVARLFDFLAIDEPLTIYREEDDARTERRSRNFRANMMARDILWQRNRHALRRYGTAHLYLIESARRELRHPDGDPRLGKRLVLQALAERPQHLRHWPWLLYMHAPLPARRWLRRLDVAPQRRHLRLQPG
jgi:glycosyltransferase involved in cell wall biosynthesis